MNQVQSVIVAVGVAVAGVVALFLGQNEVATMCIGAEVGLLAPSPVTKP